MVGSINGIQELCGNLLPVIPDRPEVQVPLELPVHGPSHFLGLGLLFLLSELLEVRILFVFLLLFLLFGLFLSPCPEFQTDLLPVWALRPPLALPRNCLGVLRHLEPPDWEPLPLLYPCFSSFFFFFRGTTSSSPAGSSVISSSSSAWLHFFPCLGAAGAGSEGLAGIPASAARSGKVAGRL